MGQGGANCTMSMPSFIQSLMTYVENLSERHACKIFNVETNEYVFRTVPLLLSEMYTALQETDVRVLQLCYVEGDAARARSSAVRWTR